MNRSIAVDRDSLSKDAEENSVSLNGVSSCRIRFWPCPVFSIQLHPEASPIPLNIMNPFERFRKRWRTPGERDYRLGKGRESCFPPTASMKRDAGNREEEPGGILLDSEMCACGRGNGDSAASATAVVRLPVVAPSACIVGLAVAGSFGASLLGLPLPYRFAPLALTEAAMYHWIPFG